MRTPTRIQHVDVWRLIAVALVILHHIISYSTLHPYFSEAPGFVFRMAGIGKLGVLIFFCISGFVICRGLMFESAVSSTVSLSSFYVRRFLRIVPPLILYLITVRVLTEAGAITSIPSELAKSAAFLCNIEIRHYPCGFFTGHTWSLAYEEQFYVLFPVLFSLLGLLTKPRILLAVVAIMAVAALGAFAYSYASIAEYLTMFLYLLSGCAAALYWERLHPLLAKVSVPMWLMSLVAMLTLGLNLNLEPHVRLLFAAVVQPFFICIVVLGTPVHIRWVKQLFESNRLSYFGRMSYTVYLWQQLATAWYPSIPPWSTLLMLLAVMVFAHYSYRYFEGPLIRLGAKYTNNVKLRRQLVATA